MYPFPVTSVALWLSNDCCSLSAWLRQSLDPLTAAWLHFSSNGYSTVHTGETEKQSEGQSDIVWPIVFPETISVSQIADCIIQKIFDHITILRSILVTNWLHCTLNSSEYLHKYVQTWALPFLHFPMPANWPYIQSMQNIISVLHVPCFCNIMKWTNYLSFTKCFYHRILVLIIILDYHKSTGSITAMHWDWILQKV